MKKLPAKYYYDDTEPQRIKTFIESYCRINKDGALFKKGDLMKVQPWQWEIIKDVFGTKRKSDGLRRYVYVWIEIPKKNGKSGLLSALQLYLLQNEEQGGLGYGAANTKDQANLILKDAKEMIQLDRNLSRIFDIKQYHVAHKKSNSEYKIISADSSGVHGANLSFCFYDEIHAGSVDHQVKDLWDALRKSIVTRAEPLIFVITNSGIKGTFPHELHKYAKKVEDNVITDDRWYVKTYNAPEDCDIFSEKVFASVNPGYKSVIPKRYWEGEVQEIKNEPLSEEVWKRLHLGIWVSSTQAWSIADIWQRGFERKKELSEFSGHECILGLDFADSRDMNSLSIIIPPTFYDDDGKAILFKENKNTKFEWFNLQWCPSSTVDRRKREENLRFKEWVNDKYVKVTSGDFRDSETIAADIIKMTEDLDVVRVGFDRAKSDVVVPRLMENEMECEPWAQTPYSMNNTVQKLDELITTGQVNHQGNPVLEWQIGNVELYSDREQLQWVHKTKSKDKIDGIVSFLNGLKSYMELIKDPQIQSDPETWIS